MVAGEATDVVDGDCDNLERFESAWQGRKTAGTACQVPLKTATGGGRARCETEVLPSGCSF